MLGKKKKAGDGDILVKVGRIGSPVKEIALNGSRTVEDAIKAAGLSQKDTEIVQVNGSEIDDLSQDLNDGDRVILVKHIEGGSF